MKEKNEKLNNLIELNNDTNKANENNNDINNNMNINNSIDNNFLEDNEDNDHQDLVNLSLLLNNSFISIARNSFNQRNSYVFQEGNSIGEQEQFLKID